MTPEQIADIAELAAHRATITGHEINTVVAAIAKQTRHTSPARGFCILET